LRLERVKIEFQLAFEGGRDTALVRGIRFETCVALRW
jgi:hypothetical protein